MKEFFVNLMAGFGINDMFDILITAFIIYKLLGLIRETRAQQLVKGLMIVVAAYFISDFFDLNTINWILKGAFTFGIFAIVVVFQPELRRALEYMGRSKFASRKGYMNADLEQAKRTVRELTDAINYFSESRTGALMVFEREITLEDISESGTILNAEISSQILGNIFYEGAPLHDGATIIRGNRVYAAGCVLPLTENRNLNKNLGTRHRAGIGISEKSDALVIIVSEETGVVSMASDGKLYRYLTKKKISDRLENLYIDIEAENSSFRFSKVLERIGIGKDKKNVE